MAARTQAEKDHMVRALKHEKSTLPERNAFGGENHKLIDEQIALIEGTSDWDLSTEEAMDEFGDEGIVTLELTEAWLDGATVDTPASEESLAATLQV